MFIITPLTISFACGADAAALLVALDSEGTGAVVADSTSEAFTLNTNPKHKREK